VIMTIFTFLAGLMPVLLAILEALNNHYANKKAIKKAAFDLSLSELDAADKRMQLPNNP